MNFLYKVIRGFWIKDYTFFEFISFFMIVTSGMDWWQAILSMIGVLFANNLLMDVFGTRDERR